MKRIQLLTDQPIQEFDDPKRDGLGFNTYAQILASAALGTPGPFTIGVFGEWGTGKTSLMRMVKRDLSDQPGVVTVWFNAWRFEQEQHPIVALVATIIRGLEAQRGALDKLKDGGKALVTALRAVAYGFSAKAKVQVPGFAEVEAAFVAKDMIEREEKLYPDPLLDRSLYFEAFERLSDIDLANKVKIVVLIDDLDRCFPDRAIKLLESIKLVLSQPGFIFVLGVSRRVIEGYLEHRYEKEYGLADFPGHSYLDKMVQLPFYIPPHRDRMPDFSASLLDRLQPSDARELEGILPIIGAACGSNPRATVRFVSNLLIDKAINRSLAAAGQMDEISVGYFAVTRSLQQRWRAVFSLLVASDPLCSSVATWLPDQLTDLASSELTKDEVEIIAELVSDSDLRELLLSSKHGRAWLEQPDLRKAAVQFLQTKRQETSQPEGVDEKKLMEQAAREERRYLQDEVHEAMNLLATGIRWEVDSTEHAIREGDIDDALYGLERMRRSSRRAYDDLNYVLKGLRNPVLETEGLVPAITDYLNDVGADWVSFDYPASIGRLPLALEHGLYRIVQEALLNALRHSGIRAQADGQVELSLTVDQGIVSLTCKDNGVGFDVDSVLSQKGPSGVGRMYDWAVQANITLRIESEPGKGTVVSASARIFA